MKTRQQYTNKEISHHDFYAQFVTPETKAWVLQRIGLAALEKSTDEYFNDIPLGRWDGFFSSSAFVEVRKLLKEAGDVNANSLGNAVCVAKTAARVILKDKDEEKTIPYTPKEVYFKDLENPAELFSLAPAEYPKPGGPHKRYKLGNNNELSLHVTVRDNRPEAKPLSYFELLPSRKLISWIRENMLSIDYDTKYIEIVVRDDGSMLIIASYNLILGNRWLWLGPVEKLDELLKEPPCLIV